MKNSTAAVADLGVRNAFVASAMHGGAPAPPSRLGAVARLAATALYSRTSRTPDKTLWAAHPVRPVDPVSLRGGLNTLFGYGCFFFFVRLFLHRRLLT
jgi:hypothetical protein